MQNLKGKQIVDCRFQIFFLFNVHNINNTVFFWLYQEIISIKIFYLFILELFFLYICFSYKLRFNLFCNLVYLLIQIKNKLVRFTKKK